MSKTGLFITFEGPEGSGKSTQAQLLSDSLRKVGTETLLLQDPGSTKLGKQLREWLLRGEIGNCTPMTEAFLFIASRTALVQEHIVPAMKKGAVVICDRFHDSTVAYQGFAGGVDPKWLDKVGRMAIGNVMPDMTIVLDLPVTEGFNRIGAGRDNIERRALDFHKRVRQGYLDLAESQKQRFITIDARLDVADIHIEVLRRISHKLMRSGNSVEAISRGAMFRELAKASTNSRNSSAHGVG